jgi:hypothetical protein
MGSAIWARIGVVPLLLTVMALIMLESGALYQAGAARCRTFCEVPAVNLAWVSLEGSQSSPVPPLRLGCTPEANQLRDFIGSKASRSTNAASLQVGPTRRPDSPFRPRVLAFRSFLSRPSGAGGVLGQEFEHPLQVLPALCLLLR